jgi:uncharacterized repeat protein (TIGR03803 family)
LTGVFNSIYSFCVNSGCPDGAHPQGNFSLGGNGAFYGATVNGGAFNEGAIFAVTTTGAESVLYSFCAQTGCPDGSSPNGVIQASDGNYYGTTEFHGANSGGTLFKLTPAGVATILYNFCAQTDCDDGDLSTNQLAQGTNGILYGAAGGGTTGSGVIFSLSNKLRSFVEPVPNSGRVGTKVTILGNNLSGSTAVSFNGTAATFTVVSGTEITTTVPTGATTGKISVTTSSGSLSSVVQFRVP